MRSPLRSTTPPCRSGASPRAQEAEASTVADRTVLRAPFAGVITAKLVNVGETALPGPTAAHPGEPRGQPIRGAGSRDRQRRAGRRPALAGPHRGSRPRARRGGSPRSIPSSDDATRARLVKIDLPETPRAPLGPVRSGAARHGPRRHGDGSLRRGRSSRPARDRVRRGFWHRPPAPGPMRPGAGRPHADLLRPLRGRNRWRWREPRSSSTGSA